MHDRNAILDKVLRTALKERRRKRQKGRGGFLRPESVISVEKLAQRQGEVEGLGCH